MRTLSNPPPLLIAWTTVAQRADADTLATATVDAGLAACVQIDGPIASVYRWQGKTETAQEFRLTFKFLPENAAALEHHIREHHPYDTPEWVVVAASHVAEKYLSWVKANPSTPPL